MDKNYDRGQLVARLENDENRLSMLEDRMKQSEQEYGRIFDDYYRLDKKVNNLHTLHTHFRRYLNDKINSVDKDASKELDKIVEILQQFDERIEKLEHDAHHGHRIEAIGFRPTYESEVD